MAETNKKQALVNEILGRIADKWTLLVIDTLVEGGKMRFTELKNAVPGVSQKMLTKTLRQLERDGLVTRHVYPVVPPRVDYKLTSRGESFGESVCGVWIWVEKHAFDIERSRQAFDKKR